MIHDIDIVLALVRSPIRRIDAAGVRVLSASEDIANARLVFANGTVANLTASRVTTESLRKIRVFQGNAYLSLDYAARRLAIYQLRGRTIQHRTVTVGGQQPLQAELAAFIRAIRTGRRPLVPAEDARQALAIAKRIETTIRRANGSLVDGR
jgi:predicted dehydrogenase